MEDTCQLCQEAPGDTLHAIRDCGEIRTMWQNQDVPLFNRFLCMESDEWLTWNFSHDCNIIGEDWRLVFVATYWWAWRRNIMLEIFKGKNIFNNNILVSVN